MKERSLPPKKMKTHGRNPSYMRDKVYREPLMSLHVAGSDFKVAEPILGASINGVLRWSGCLVRSQGLGSWTR